MTAKITDEEARRLSGDGANTPPGLEAPSRSEGDLNRNSYRRSNVADRLAVRAVVNDDGTPIAQGTEALLADLVAGVVALLDRPDPESVQVTQANDVELVVEERVKHEARPRRSVDDGEYVRPLIDNHGRPYVRAEIHEPLTGFGEVSTAQLSPLVQEDFPYNANTRRVRVLTDGSGAVTVANTIATLSTGTTTSSDVLFETRRHAKYHMGQGLQARMAVAFGAPVLGTEQFCGYGNEEDALGFFYASSSIVFGVLHRFGGEHEIQTLTITTGAVTASGTITITLNGDETEVEVVQNDTVTDVARAIGAVTFGEHEAIVIGDTVVFISHHAEAETDFTLDDTDTTGTVGSFAETVVGKVPTNTFISQSKWNIDKMDGSNDLGTNPSGMILTPTFGNTYEVEYQDGFGDIIYFVENQNTGKFHGVHRISYTNQNTIVNIQNPTLPMYASVKNLGTTSDIVMKLSSLAAFTEGVIAEEGLGNSTAATLSGDLTTETAIFTVLNNPVFQGVDNRVNIAPNIFVISANGAGAAKFTTIRIRLNPIIGGAPSFSDVDAATSVAAVDSAGTTVSGGIVVSIFDFDADFREVINIAALSKELPPGTWLTITAQIDGGTSDVDASLNWDEQF